MVSQKSTYFPNNTVINHLKVKKDKISFLSNSRYS